MKQKISVNSNTSKSESIVKMNVQEATANSICSCTESLKISDRGLRFRYLMRCITIWLVYKSCATIRWSLRNFCDLRVYIYYSMFKRLVACSRLSVRRHGTKEHVRLKNERRVEGGLPPKSPVVARFFFFAPAAISLFPTDWEPGKGKAFGGRENPRQIFNSWGTKKCFVLEQISQIYYCIL